MYGLSKYRRRAGLGESRLREDTSYYIRRSRDLHSALYEQVHPGPGLGDCRAPSGNGGSTARMAGEAPQGQSAGEAGS